jgi:type IV secretory pathway protease TraF
MRAAAIAVVGIAGVLLILAPAAVPAPPRLVWNATASAPEGLYVLQPRRTLAVGDWTAVQPSPELAGWLSARGYLPNGALLIKRVAALTPSRVCRDGDRVTIDGATAAKAESRDRLGRDLPAWRGCMVLRPDQVFVLNSAQGSLDSRYFGALARTRVVGRAAPFWLLRDPRHGR